MCPDQSGKNEYSPVSCKWLMAVNCPRSNRSPDQLLNLWKAPVTRETCIPSTWLAQTSFWLLWLWAYCCGNFNRSDGPVYKHLPATIWVTLTLKSAFCNMLAAVLQLLLWMWTSSVSGLHHTFSGYTNTWLVHSTWRQA